MASNCASALSIGIAIYPDDGADAATLIANADAALYRAKARGRGSIRFFEAEMDQQLRERRALQHDLRSAIERDELSLHYQPQARIDGEIIGFEALVRWQHPTRGLISPGTFIPLAEESGLIVPIGEWILREACREAASWPKPLQIAINLSPVQFRHGDLPGLVHSVLLETGLAPRRLELEITEGVLIDDFSRARLDPAPAQGARRAHRHGRFRHRLLVAVLSAGLSRSTRSRSTSFISNLEQNRQSADHRPRGHRARAAVSSCRWSPRASRPTSSSPSWREEPCDEVQGYLIGRPLPIACYGALIGDETRTQPEPEASKPAMAASAF